MENSLSIIEHNNYSNIFVRIENQYTPVENFTFKFDEITHFYPADNSGLTVILVLKTMNFCPTITYANFNDFFTFMVEKIATLKNTVQLFELVVNADLSCDWSVRPQHSGAI
ncbi:hypothetical protein [Providencia sp. PROV169]|uniref:hypothetical protein n=1 Tax=Providencia sp. PROV169 TaxID=2949875 RepID=UPI002349FE4D|nr:hypothetical protein [Providencia sp. PROV169]